ncbi:MAG: malate:quinone oxidoreductase [Chloroflexota bacterium]
MSDSTSGVALGRGAPVVLIGAGIMSATLGLLLKELQPDLTIDIVERLDVAAAESSDAWNNAGTGHSAFCELNYTPERADGTIDTAKAVQIAESFEVSKQFWAYLVQRGLIQSPETFIRRIPHMSFVWGQEGRAFLQRRYAALQESYLFRGMQYSEDRGQLAEWMPLVMDGRNPAQVCAATRMDIGTDVNFGAFTRQAFQHLQTLPGVTIHYNHEVRDLRRRADGRWEVWARERASGDEREWLASFVFIGAGGGSLPLLLKSNIPEGQGYGGFPVSGQWLVCKNPDIVERHYAKVYGKAAVGSPPMSVPHLDTRFIDGRRALFFGPYAGFSTRFLKHGSVLDLPLSMRVNNVIPMLAAGMDNIPLTKYLIEQVVQSPEDRLEALRAFYPQAAMEDWELQVAGQRVQVIKRDDEHGGILEFGTEVVSAADGSIAALLGASPGASTAVTIMLTLMRRCFPDHMRSQEWQARLVRMLPSYGQTLGDNPQLCDRIRAYTSEVLRLADAPAAA